MNKGITLIILLVVFVAMGLVMFSHLGGQEPQEQPALSASGPGTPPVQSPFASPLQAPQGDAGSLRSIDPPLSSNVRSPLPAPSGSDGTPQPVRLTPASDGRPTQPAASAPAQPSETNLDAPSSREPGDTRPSEAPQAPPAEATRNTVEAAPATSPPQAPQSSEAKPQLTPAPPAEKPANGSPGLTPWKTPPKNAQSGSAPPSPQASPQAPGQVPTQAPSGTRTLRNISLTFAGQGMQLHIEADGPFACNAFVLNDPNRLVIDLPGSWKGMRKPATPRNALIKNARLGQQPSGPRLVLDLTGPLKGHKVERSGNVTRIVMQ